MLLHVAELNASQRALGLSALAGTMLGAGGAVVGSWARTARRASACNALC